ncbi:RNA polymerase sigma factor [Streptomyces sp. NBC_00057]|uniref:RNA polymerase sigma factor n=1 Tax=Streptomyces sp. NBC_00057 TaxID=2975634 RepID=UPI00386CEF18
MPRTENAPERKHRLRALGTPYDDEPPPTLTELYQARRLDMVRLALFLVDDLHTAEDVVQDAFAAVCRTHGTSLDGLQDPGAYLYTAVVNAARSVLRRRRSACCPAARWTRLRRRPPAPRASMNHCRPHLRARSARPVRTPV